jgi:hypothetical protein
MAREGPPQPPPDPADKTRGGEIILRKPWQRMTFIAGLSVPVVLLLVLYLASR